MRSPNHRGNAPINSHTAIDRTIGKIGQQSGDLLKTEFAGQIAERHGERQAQPLAPEVGRDVAGILREG